MSAESRPPWRAPGTQAPVVMAVSPANGPTATTIAGCGLELVVLRALGRTAVPDGVETLTGTWPGQDEPALLAYLLH